MGVLTSIVGIIFLVSSPLFAQSGKVLFLLSAADTLELNGGDKLRQTGIFLNEFYSTYWVVTRAGYDVDLATPNGAVPSIDQESLADSYWKGKSTLKKEAARFTETDDRFASPITLEEALVSKEQYVGLVVPGGQGLMVDLMYDSNTPLLLTYFAKTSKPTGLICHAPSLLLTIPKSEHPYLGFRINSVTPIEEFCIETFIMGGKPKRRRIARGLKELGLTYRSRFPKADFAVRDRNLITSQNPYSSDSFNELYLQVLTEYTSRQTELKEQTHGTER